MPRPPNDYEQRPKRTRQARAPNGVKPSRSRKNVVAFPVTDVKQAEAGVAPFLPEIQQAIDNTLSLTPLQLLAVIIKALLRNRIKR
jgi:hypothetical protein